MNSIVNCLPIRNFGVSCVHNREIIRVIKSRPPSSIHWLRRQLADPYVEKARTLNYRCRSAFKLLEINKRFKILKPGHIVVDCGAAPGSWCQVAIELTNAKRKKHTKPVGAVIGVDIKPMYPLEGATFFGNSDFTKQETKDKIMEFLKEKNLIGTRGSVDVVLSDMSPNTSGNSFLDHATIMGMAYDAMRFALAVSKLNASFLVKVFMGEDSPKFYNDMKMFYTVVKYVKPKACRKESPEIYILGTGFKGKRR